MAHIGQGGMADDWWQSAPGKIAAPPILSWESGAKKCGDFSGIYGSHGRVGEQAGGHREMANFDRIYGNYIPL